MEERRFQSAGSPQASNGTTDLLNDDVRNTPAPGDAGSDVTDTTVGHTGRNGVTPPTDPEDQRTDPTETITPPSWTVQSTLPPMHPSNPGVATVWDSSALTVSFSENIQNERLRTYLAEPIGAGFSVRLYRYNQSKEDFEVLLVRAGEHGVKIDFARLEDRERVVREGGLFDLIIKHNTGWELYWALRINPGATPSASPTPSSGATDATHRNRCA